MRGKQDPVAGILLQYVRIIHILENKAREQGAGEHSTQKYIGA